ncbi:Na+/H+ antiporter NhaC [Spirochaetia bacterium]|nr:Na+/H+ antiporter NhaC [Spirochaetia bacterium]
MKKQRSINIWLSLVPIVVVIVLGLMSVTTWGAGMNIPLLSSIVAAALVGIWLGIPWEELQKSLVHGVARALPAIFILIIVGSIVGTWILSGIIPTLIYYSLKVINPVIFIPACMVVTAIIATATGTSFTSIATIGIALMATGQGMGFPAPLVAGAIISGAYFGDSFSPLSDTTNLASAMSGCTLFELIGHMVWTSLPGLIISCIIFYFLGLPYSGASAANTETIRVITGGLESAFRISPLLLLVPVITIVLSIMRVPSLPTLLCVSVLGGLAGMVFQGASIGAVIVAMTRGFSSSTGIQMLDSLLTRGGINSMSNTVVMLSMATALGGILERIGALDSILTKAMKRVHSNGALVSVTALSGLVVAFATGAQLLAIMLPARMFSGEYAKRNLHAKNLGRVAQSIGAVAINLVPWSVPAIFAANMLGVEAILFIPYVIFAYVILILNVLYGFIGFTIAPADQTSKTETPAVK